jgi:putative transposon-encoded protein
MPAEWSEGYRLINSYEYDDIFSKQHFLSLLKAAEIDYKHQSNEIYVFHQDYHVVHALINSSTPRSGDWPVPADAPEHYESINKIVSKGGDSGKVILPVSWIGHNAIVYNLMNGEKTDEKIVKADGNSGRLYVSHQWRGHKVRALRLD